MDFRRDIPGWLHSNEAPQVERICKMAGGKTIIEVGVFAGRTTQVMASTCLTHDIYSIDPWPILPEGFKWEGMTDYTGEKFGINDTKRIFETEILAKYDNVHQIHGFFPGDLPIEATKNVGMVYWDSDSLDNARHVFDQFKYAWELMDGKGILGGHTFAHWMPVVVEAAREFGIYTGADVILPPSGSIWYMMKNE